MSDHTDDLVTVAGCCVRRLRGGSGAPRVFVHGAGGGRGRRQIARQRGRGARRLSPGAPRVRRCRGIELLAIAT